MSITTQEFLNKLQRIQLKLKEDDTPLRLASYSAIALQSVRIFTQGKDSSGSKIGDYSQKDIWINPDAKSFVPRNSGGFTGKGKTGKSVFALTGKPHKTTFFEGWKGFREAQGLQSGTVDLNYTGELFSDFCNPQGGVPTTRKVTNTEFVTSLKRNLSKLKLAGNEDRFDATIGNLTDSEKDKFYTVARFELRKLLNS